MRGALDLNSRLFRTASRMADGIKESALQMMPDSTSSAATSLNIMNDQQPIQGNTPTAASNDPLSAMASAFNIPGLPNFAGFVRMPAEIMQAGMEAGFNTVNEIQKNMATAANSFGIPNPLSMLNFGSPAAGVDIRRPHGHVNGVPVSNGGVSIQTQGIPPVNLSSLTPAQMAALIQTLQTQTQIQPVPIPIQMQPVPIPVQNSNLSPEAQQRITKFIQYVQATGNLPRPQDVPTLPATEYAAAVQIMQAQGILQNPNHSATVPTANLLPSALTQPFAAAATALTPGNPPLQIVTTPTPPGGVPNLAPEAVPVPVPVPVSASAPVPVSASAPAPPPSPASMASGPTA